MEFVKKYGLTIDSMNNAGHNIHEDYGNA